MVSNFIHLHIHSHYSLLDGLAKIDDLVAKAVEYKMPALALTDHGNMYGAIEFYKKCKKAGIKPIIGVEVYVAIDSRHDKRPNIDNRRHHLVLLAKNEIGYKNLIKLVTLSHLEGFYYKPRIDKEILSEYSEGLIGLSACGAGEIPKAVLHNKSFELAEKIAKEHENIFGKGNFYLEIMHHPNIKEYPIIKEKLIQLSEKTGIPLAATHDIHYINKEDNEAHDTLVAVQTNSTLTDSNRLTMKGEDFSFISSEQAQKYFSDAPEAVKNTVKIAEQCNLKIELGKWVFPKIEITNKNTPEEEITRLADEGLKLFIKNNPDENIKAKERVDYELKIINGKGYAPYFLVVADIINFAKQNDIYTNTRGSAAGSLVSYIIGITNIDPIKYDLPFERFLNMERPSPPDIDMDFADDRRDEVIEYVKEKYGKEKVAQIGTFGTMLARGSVRDVTRALDYPYTLGDKIANLIPLGSQGLPMTIDLAMKIAPELAELYKNDKDTKRIIDIAKRVEGCARHISVHAAGVVIAPTDLTNFIPLQYEPKGEKIITQYDMYSVDPDYGGIGLLKFDLLGIRNLSILRRSVGLVKKLRNISVDIENIPLDDKKTFELLSRGETMGLFQLGGSGMTRWLRELKPTTIHDINAMVALFRPGPMVNIPTYIKRKHGEEPVTYIDPRLKNILENTYGVITYQEDVLLIAIKIAGYNWGTVDKFRKAIGKKIPAEMAKQEKTFIEGCQTHGGLTPEKSEALWKLFDPFKGYGFNKAHAASYGKVAYQTAYMKANFSAEYMTAVLTAESGDTEKIAEIIAECKRMKIPVLPPNINESFGDFTVVKNIDIASRSDDQIRFGLYTIKNLGQEIANAIIEERKNHGKFESFSNFLERIKHRNLNKKSLESLIKAGAMDSLGERGQFLSNMDEALEYNKDMASNAGGNQDSLFELMEDKSSVPRFTLKKAIPASAEDKLSWEKDLLGLYISGHPLDKFQEQIKKYGATIKEIKEKSEGMPITIGGIVETVKLITTKAGDQMAFLKIADFTDNIEVVVFPKIFVEYRTIFSLDKCVALQGRISKRNNTTSIIAEKIKELKEK